MIIPATNQPNIAGSFTLATNFPAIKAIHIKQIKSNIPFNMTTPSFLFYFTIP